MKPIQLTAGTRAVALSFVLAAAVGCGERLSDTSSGTPEPRAASPSAVVIGTAPAEPQAPSQGDTAQTTSPAGAQGELTKREESMERPKEGDSNSFSTLDPTTPQKAKGVNAQELPGRNNP
jgi:hypothetical protein